AFQATFLVLVRKAAGVRNEAPLANWLHGVAFRIAARARAGRTRRRASEKQEEAMTVTIDDDAATRELRSTVQEEVNRLPEKYRVPVVLCYLQGKTNNEAAQQLGWPVGTVKGRLTRARELMRTRLARRGFGAGTGATAIFSQTPAASAV